jgi:hypothetical protein
MLKKNDVALLRKRGGGGYYISKGIKHGAFCLCVISGGLRA